VGIEPVMILLKTVLVPLMVTTRRFVSWAYRTVTGIHVKVDMDAE
jgi:hypothetical protein